MSKNKSVDQLFQDQEQRDKFSGVVLITQGNRELYSRAFGFASRAWKIRNTMDTRFDTASITKLFTAAAVLQLIEGNLIEFGTSAVDFLGLEGTKISRDVNVFHLLTHTSGIGDDCEEEDGEVYEDLWQTKPNYSIRNTEDFLPQFINKEPNFPPGQGCRYCNCSYVLLGLMIEKATGTIYRDYIRENIFKRSGMFDSDFFDMQRVNERVAEGADPIKIEERTITGWKRNIYSYPPIGSPDGGAHVTAQDLDRFFRIIQSGKLVGPELTAAFLSPHVLYKDKGDWIMKYGYCFWFYIEKNNDILFLQKEGINAGASAVIRHYPTKDINVIILSNMEEGVWEPVRQVHDLIGTIV